MAGMFPFLICFGHVHFPGWCMYTMKYILLTLSKQKLIIFVSVDHDSQGISGYDSQDFSGITEIRNLQIHANILSI